MMNKLTRLIILSIIANLTTIILCLHAGTQGGESYTDWITFLLLLPVVWIISLILLIVFSYKNRKIYFQRAILKWSVPLILCCTPVPICIIYSSFFVSSTYPVESDTLDHHDYLLRHEEWLYRSNNKMAVNKYYRIYNKDDTNGNKDSTWTYFSKSGDILKIERYDNGKLISTVNKNK